MSPALDAAAAAGPLRVPQRVPRSRAAAEPSTAIAGRSAEREHRADAEHRCRRETSAETHSAAPVEIAPPRPTSVPASGKPATSGHAWAVQLGSFASHENADKLARQLKAQGFAVYVAARRLGILPAVPRARRTHGGPRRRRPNGREAEVTGTGREFGAPGALTGGLQICDL